MKRTWYVNPLPVLGSGSNFALLLVCRETNELNRLKGIDKESEAITDMKYAAEKDISVGKYPCGMGEDSLRGKCFKIGRQYIEAIIERILFSRIRKWQGRKNQKGTLFSESLDLWHRGDFTFFDRCITKASLLIFRHFLGLEHEIMLLVR